MSQPTEIRLRPTTSRERARRRPPPSPRQRRPLLLVPLAVVVAIVAAALIYDDSRSDLIAPGVRAASVPVGSLHASAARARLGTALGGQLKAPLVVDARGRRIVLPVTTLHPRVDVAALVRRAVAVSRRGFIVTRVWHGLTGHRVDVDLPAPVSYSGAALDQLVARVARDVDRPARDASVDPSGQGLRKVSSADGVSVDNRRLRAELVAALGRPGGGRTVGAPLRTLHPHVTTAMLVSRYPAYIIVDRADFELKFYRHLQLYRSYPVAIGMQGLETPAGLYDIQWKQVNPSWYVPNSAWAGALAGRTIPPGPQDPIKARWMAFDGAAGIHGIDPSEYDTIGHTASHGCVRMTIPDVIELYSMAPVGTPVYVA